MKHIKMENCSVNKIYSGVYRILFPNNKVYIGISNNIYRRMLEHNSDFRNHLPIENAIQKYGKIIEFDILEEIDAQNRDKMRNREQYWIQKYKSNCKQFGYNVSEGGDGADIGANNYQAKFSEEQLQIIYNELKNNLDLTLEKIAKKYKVHLTTISNINNGHTYFHSTLKYPIRNAQQCKVCIEGVKNKLSKFTEQDLKEIYVLLIDNKITMKEIAQKYNVYPSVIQNINNGKTYINKELDYPLRKPNTGSRKLTQEQVIKIIKTIKENPKMSLASIGRQFGLNSKNISSINCGTTYKQDNENYPIR